MAPLTLRLPAGRRLPGAGRRRGRAERAGLAGSGAGELPLGPLRSATQPAGLAADAGCSCMQVTDTEETRAATGPIAETWAKAQGQTPRGAPVRPTMDAGTECTGTGSTTGTALLTTPSPRRSTSR